MIPHVATLRVDEFLLGSGHGTRSPNNSQRTVATSSLVCGLNFQPTSEAVCDYDQTPGRLGELSPGRGSSRRWHASPPVEVSAGQGLRGKPRFWAFLGIARYFRGMTGKGCLYTCILRNQTPPPTVAGDPDYQFCPLAAMKRRGGLEVAKGMGRLWLPPPDTQ